MICIVCSSCCARSHPGRTPGPKEKNDAPLALGSWSGSLRASRSSGGAQGRAPGYSPVTGCPFSVRSNVRAARRIMVWEITGSSAQVKRRNDAPDWRVAIGSRIGALRQGGHMPLAPGRGQIEGRQVSPGDAVFKRLQPQATSRNNANTKRARQRIGGPTRGWGRGWGCGDPLCEAPGS